MGFDYSDVDIGKVDPGTVSLGTDLQDCALIAQTFERGAHATPTEAAVFATFSRSLANMKATSGAAVGSMSSYLQAPTDAADVNVQNASQLSANAGISPNDTQVNAGSQAATDQFLQSLNVGDIASATLGTSAGKTLLDWAKDCIPCGFRIEAFLELNPIKDLLNALEADIKRTLETLMAMLDMLKNLNVYGDICDLLNMLSFTCVPDLQRIIAVLMALLLLDTTKLDALFDLIKTLIAPLFTPVLMTLSALLDKFVTLVTKPLECILDSFEQQMNKLEFEVPRASKSVASQVGAKVATGMKQVVPSQDLMDDAHAQIKQARKEINQFKTGLKSSMKELTDKVTEAKRAIEDKLDFYLKEIKALLNDTGLTDAAHLRLSLRKLSIVRLINIIISLIEAMAKGHPACSGSGKTPEQNEIDNFFQVYLNPNSPFKMWVDDEGLVHIDNKADPATEGLLSNTGNVFKFEGNNFIDPTVEELSNDVAQALSEPVSITMPCLRKASVTDAEKINKWMAELDQA